MPGPGVIHGPNGETARILSDAELVVDIEAEDHGLHIGVLAIGILASVILTGMAGGGGALGLIGAAIGTVVALVFMTPINAAAAWMVGKMFGHDFGSFPCLLLRVGAVTAAYTAVMAGATIVLGPMFSLVLGLPVMLVLAVWLLGMDVLQSMIFSIVMSSVKWILAAFVMASMASLINMGAPDMSDMDMQMWEDEYGEYGEFDDYTEYEQFLEYEDADTYDDEYYEDW